MNRGAPDMLTDEDLEHLKNAFPRDRLCVKVNSFNRERSRAMLVLYLQHTDVMDRLDLVDPGWTSEAIAEERAGESVYVRLRLTIKGVWRENVGEGQDPKAAYSDALKRAAMLFGVGRYLYDSPQVWVDYNEAQDRFREWTVDDYERVAKGAPPPPAPQPPRSSPRARGAGPRARGAGQAQARPVRIVPAQAPGPAAPGGGPACCSQPMGVNRYNPNQWYCNKCRRKEARVLA